MTPSHRRALVECGKITDIVILFVVLSVAYSISVLRPQPFLSLGVQHPILSLIETVALGIAWHLSLSKAGLYWSHRLISSFQELAELSRGVLLCSFFSFLWLLLVVVQPAREAGVCLTISLIFGLIAMEILVAVRGAMRFITREIRKRGLNLRHVIIVGSNRRAADFARSLDDSPGWGYHLHGFVDDVWCGERTSPAFREKLLGGFDQLPVFLRTLAIDEVIVALPIASFYNQIAQIIQICKQHGILVRFTGDLFDSARSKGAQFATGSVGTITLHDDSWDAWAYLIKRVFDLVFACFLLVLFAPLLVLIAVLIKLDSPGPIFFLQTRLGLGKRLFTIYKFRTMVVDAERLMQQVIHLNETQGPTFKLTNDPRITKIGGVLRKTSLDELPQLLNIVTGHMSFVGPRPLPLRDYEGFSEDWHRRRFSVKPGITCLWQVMGRSSIAFDEWMALDMRYIDDWSVWLDIKILAQTIPAVLRGSGAA